jgi:hypothetical protein
VYSETLGIRNILKPVRDALTGIEENPLEKWRPFVMETVLLTLQTEGHQDNTKYIFDPNKIKARYKKLNKLVSDFTAASTMEKLLDLANEYARRTGWTRSISKNGHGVVIDLEEIKIPVSEFIPEIEAELQEIYRSMMQKR